MRTAIKIVACASALSLAATPLMAENGNWQVGNDQIHVVDNTIDTSTADGRMRLLARIERAAEKLCRDRVGSSRLECEVDTVRQTAATKSNWGRALTLALSERGAERMAAR